MTQIVVTLEEGSTKVNRRLNAFDRLAGSVSMDMIDTDDPRTKYLLSK